MRPPSGPLNCTPKLVRMKDAREVSTAPLVAVGLIGGFGLSHPLAKKIGAWPAVLTVTAASAGAAHLAVDARGETA